MPAGGPRDDAKYLSAAVEALVRAIDGLVGRLGRAAERTGTHGASLSCSGA